MKTLLKSLFAAALLVLAAGPVAADEPGFKVVVQASNPIKSITRTQLSRLFLKKTSTWESGEHVVPVDQSDDAKELVLAPQVPLAGHK